MLRISLWARSAALCLVVAVVPVAAAQPAGAEEPVGHVYVQTNAAAGNAVIGFDRSADGSLALDETVATGGLGTGAGLGNQGALAITSDGDHLLAVNAGSDDVSLFDVTDEGLELDDVQAVGDHPVSVAVSGDLVYVLNQGADTIQALRISDEDTLVGIPRSTRPLSGLNTAAAQVAEGRLLGAETLRLIGRAIETLPPMQAQVIRLRDVLGWSSEEVCNALELSETNQRVLLHRARTRVRRELDEYLRTESENW
jgi:Sigma-70, region 4/Lactonase, 7-bladed beta-propeller